MDKQQASLLLTCDCISWRLDLFEQALGRISDAVRGEDSLAEVRFGYRLRDDIVFLAIDPGLFGDSDLGTLAVSVAQLPGLRVLKLPADGSSPDQIRKKALASCDVVEGALVVAEAVGHLRRTLGMSDDRRTTLRLDVDLPVRYETPGGWVQAIARDLSLSGVLVKTGAHRPDLGEVVGIELFSDSEAPISAVATVARHVTDGFGARLTLNLEAQRDIYLRLRPLRLSTSRRKQGRAPIHTDVDLVLGGARIKGVTENLSRQGAFVRGETPAQPGQPIHLDLHLNKGQSVPADGKVMRLAPAPDLKDPIGLGVELTPLSTKAREMLDQFITEALAQPFARVLLAVPDETLRRSLATALRQERCEIVNANSSEEAFEEIAANLLSLDFVVLDHTLPGAGVSVLLHRIRDVGHELDLPVAVILDDTRQEGALLRAGATQIALRSPVEVLLPPWLETIHERRMMKTGPISRGSARVS